MTCKMDIDSDDEDNNVMSSYQLVEKVLDTNSREYAVAVSTRSLNEKAHKDMIDYGFSHPITMTPNLLRDRQPLRIIHKLCNKACAIYCVTPFFIGVNCNSINDIFRAAYEKWFVPNECNITWGNFAAQLIGCWRRSSPKSIDDIVAAHQELCTKVRERQKVLDITDSLGSPDDMVTKFHSYFEILQSFSSTLIIIDNANWSKEGVLLVRILEEAGSSKSSVRAEGESPISVTRLTLGEAIEIMLEMQQATESEEEKTRGLKCVVTTRTLY